MPMYLLLVSAFWMSNRYPEILPARKKVPKTILSLREKQKILTKLSQKPQNVYQFHKGFPVDSPEQPKVDIDTKLFVNVYPTYIDFARVTGNDKNLRHLYEHQRINEIRME